MNSPTPLPSLKDRFYAAAAGLWRAGKGQAATSGPAAVAGWALLAVAVVCCYWSPVASLVGRWWSDPDYLYGFLVPVFAAYLLWARRGMLASAKTAEEIRGVGALGRLCRDATNGGLLLVRSLGSGFSLPVSGGPGASARRPAGPRMGLAFGGVPGVHGAAAACWPTC